ncbi:histone H2A-like 3 [Crocuta crocuta]
MMSGRRGRCYSYRRRKCALSHSGRAELQFPVSLVERLLRESCHAQHLSPSTPVFLAGVPEYLMANILDLAGKEALSNHKMRITPEHLQRALDSNQHLSRLLEGNASSPVHQMPQVKEC